MTKTLVKFILSFQNFGKKIACAMRHNRIAIQLNTVVSHCEGPGIEVGKTLASAGHVTLMKICSRGRVGECRIYNSSRRHVAEYEVGFLSCLHFAKRNSLYSEVTLKPKKVIFGGNIFLNYDKSLIFCLIPAWIFAKKNGIKCACSISSIVSFRR